MAKKIISSVIADNNNRIQYDEVCKRILADKYIIAKILKHTLPEYKNYSLKEIVDNYIDGSPLISTVAVNPDEKGNGEFVETLNSENIIANEGKVTFDIMFKAIVPETYERKQMFINLEAQKAFNVGYPIASRGVFYCSRMLSKQYGEVFTNSRYDKLQKVTSIFLCNNVTDKVHKNTITSFELNEHNIYGSITTDKSAYDLLSVVIVCYNDKDNSTANELINMLSVLFSNKITADKKINMLSSKYGIPMTTDFKGEVNSMCNMSQGLIEQGIEQTTINSMFYLINNKHWDFKDCFEMFNIPEEKQATYIEAVNELINNSNN